ncbi:hypothetical protein [Mycoplasma sp. VS30B]
MKLNWKATLSVVISLVFAGCAATGIALKFEHKLSLRKTRQENKDKLNDWVAELKKKSNELYEAAQSNNYVYYMNEIKSYEKRLDDEIKELEDDLLFGLNITKMRYEIELETFEDELNRVNNLKENLKYVSNKIQIINEWINKKDSKIKEILIKNNKMVQTLSWVQNWNTFSINDNGIKFGLMKWFIDILSSEKITNSTSDKQVYQELLNIIEEKHKILGVRAKENVRNKADEIINQAREIFSQEMTVESFNKFVDLIEKYLNLYYKNISSLNTEPDLSDIYNKKKDTLETFMRFEPFKNKYQDAVNKNASIVKVDPKVSEEEKQKQYWKFIQFVNPILRDGYLLLGFHLEPYKQFKEIKTQFYNFIANEINNSDLKFNALNEAKEIIFKYTNEYVLNKDKLQDFSAIVNNYKNELEEFKTKYQSQLG